MSHSPSEFSGDGVSRGERLTGKAWEGGVPTGEVETALNRSGAHHWVGVVELRFTQLMVVAMTGLVLTSAITRSIGKPIAWTVDLALLTFAWSVFVGADVALRNGRMVNIDLLVQRLPRRVSVVVELFNTVLIIAFLTTMIGLGFWLSYTTRFRSFSGLPWLSYTWATLAVPVGCAFMLWTTLRSAVEQFRKLRSSDMRPPMDEKRVADLEHGDGGPV